MISLDPSIRPPIPRDLKQRFQTPALGVNFPLGSDELEKILDQYQRIESLYAQLESCSLMEIQKLPQGESPLGLEESIAIGMHAINKRFSIIPYDTQILTLLGLLSTPGETRGRLSQVRTGEGKSTIITLIAFVLALQGKSVDIISSSHYLAMRDQKKYAPFFEGFGITTSHICDKEPQAEAFQATILYGMVVDFEFALMRETLHTKAIFSSLRKNFDSVIVDEVDNLLIDTSLNSARIAYPSKRSFHWVYDPMIRFVEANTQELLSRRSCHDLGKLRTFLGKYGPIEQLSDEKLLSLLHSALSALYLKEKDVDYVLKRSPNEKMVIQIIDKENTGRICEGLRWGEGLHEFLEIKHNLSPEEETITPISLSHAVFYDQYKGNKGKIFGLSGTLGSSIEREELRTIYNLDFFDAPLHHSFKRIDYLPEISFSKEEYETTLISKIKQKQQEGRPVLILAPSIKESQEIYTLCRSFEVSCQLFNEMQSENPDAIIGNAGAPGQVTITTNNAGRGTDIRLHEGSARAGGLHVILTFYPYSKRVEEQGLGRGGRQGEMGSSEVLLLAEKLKSQGLSIERSNDRTLDYLELKDLLTMRLVSREWKKRVDDYPIFALSSFRGKTIRRQVSLHVNRAQSERVVAEFVDHFWKSLKAWKQSVLSPSFFERMQKHAEESKGASQFQSKWDMTRRISRIESEAIHEWVQYFYRPSEKLILEGEDERIIPGLFQSQKQNWESLFDEAQLRV